MASIIRPSKVQRMPRDREPFSEPSEIGPSRTGSVTASTGYKETHLSAESIGMADSDNLQEARNDALRFTNDSIELEEIDGRERARRGRNRERKRGHPFGARPDAVPKQCCGLGSPPVRWSILGVGVVGLVCAGAGALLGALRASGRDHIAVALLMIGIGVVLVSVSAVAWRVTSRENCGSFFGFTGITGRIPPARPIHPYAAMIYPEFQFRTPPPSYQASMQEYRLRLLLLDRLQPTSSPPPTYRSNASSIVAAAGGTVRESRPPSYCARGNATPNANLVPSKKDANLVRIVQTEADPVILSGDQTPPIAAVEVLAHL
uniref:Uncharacterized protein n=1 Tax=Vespula pensylvanica TaxID=30213 RepID=A0A834PD80_VESPE|nr:hypothetical protein H0235_004131 [Vespula pensylvanica]